MSDPGKTAPSPATGASTTSEVADDDLWEDLEVPSLPAVEVAPAKGPHGDADTAKTERTEIKLDLKTEKTEVKPQGVTVPRSNVAAPPPRVVRAPRPVATPVPESGPKPVRPPPPPAAPAPAAQAPAAPAPAAQAPAAQAPAGPAARSPRTITPDLAPSPAIVEAAERPLATQPGVASLQVQRARKLVGTLEKRLLVLRAHERTSEAPRRARLLVELGLACERAGERKRALEAFQEAMIADPALLPAVQGARRTSPGASLPQRLALLDHEQQLARDERGRADLLVERARALEAAGGDEGAIRAAYRDALALAPSHAEALKGFEAALTRALADADAKAAPPLVKELAAHYARLADAWGDDAELSASCHASRARVLEQAGDLVGAEEAYAAALVADGRVGPVRESYKRLLARRGAWTRLRDVLAEEAGRESDRPRSVRLLLEAARISSQRLDDADQAIELLGHAAARAPTDPAVDARVLDELARKLAQRGDARGAADAQRAFLTHEQNPELRAMGLRRLAASYQKIDAWDSAIVALAEAHSIQPLHLPTQLALDRLYERRNHHDARVALWLDEAAKAREPARRAAAYVRAAHVAEDALARPDEALEYLRAAWVTDTSNLDALDELTRLLLPPNEMRHGIGGGEGRSARSLIELFEHAAQTTREPARKIAFLEKVAALYEDALGNPVKAAEVYRKVLALEPTRRFALLALQRACERSGDFRGLADAIETEADQATDRDHAAQLRVRAAETYKARVGDPARAVALVQRVLKDHPGHPQALRSLLAAQEAEGRPAQMEQTLEAILASKAATNDPVAVHLELAELRRSRLGKKPAAIASYRAALHLDPKNAVARQELAELLGEEGKHKEVAELFEQIGAVEVDPAAASAAFVRAAEVWEGRLLDDERAQQAYAQALGVSPLDLAAWDGLARIAERRGALRELEAAYRLRIEREVAHGNPVLALRFALAELLVRRGDDLPAAAAALDEVLTEAPTHAHALRLAEQVHRRTKDDAALARALTMMAHACKSSVGKRGALWELVRLQERRGGTAPPIAAYVLLYELDPHDDAAIAGIVRLASARLQEGEAQSQDGMPNVRGLLAFGLRQRIGRTRDEGLAVSLRLRLADLLEDSVDRKELQDALGQYRAITTFDAQSPTAVDGALRLADALGETEALGAAHELAAGIAESSAEQVSHLLAASDIARRRGREPAALDLAVQALRADADSVPAADAVARLAAHDPRLLVDRLMEAASAAKQPARIVALCRAGAELAAKKLDNVPVAVALLSQARGAAPPDPGLLLDLGDLYVAQRAWAEAATAYEEAVAGAADDATRVRGHRALATLHEGAIEDTLRARGHWSEVVRLAPDDVGAHRKLAGLLQAQGDVAGAIQALEGVLALAGGLDLPTQVATLQELAGLFARSGDARGAERVLRAAVRLAPDPAEEPFGLLEAHLGNDTAFAQVLTEMCAEPNADPRWHLRLGQVLVHRLGRPTDGLAELRRAVQACAASGDRPSWLLAQHGFAEALLGVGALEDAVRVVREVLHVDPVHAGMLDAGSRALLALGRKDEAALVDEVRAYVGYLDGVAGLRARRLLPTSPRPQVLDDAAIFGHVFPSAARIPAVEILDALADQLGKVFPPDLGSLGLAPRDKISPRSGHVLRAYVDRAAQALGVAEVDLYVHEAREQRMLVENFDVPAIVVPAALRTLPELEIAFAIGRMVAKIATRTYLVDKLPIRELEDLVVAAAGSFGGHVARARPDVEELARKVQKAVSRKARRQIEEMAPHVTAVDMTRAVRAIDQGASRVGFLLTGDLTSALDHVRRWDPTAMDDLGAETSVGGDLLRYALGQEAANLRRRLGTIW